MHCHGYLLPKHILDGTHLNIPEKSSEVNIFEIWPQSTHISTYFLEKKEVVIVSELPAT